MPPSPRFVTPTTTQMPVTPRLDKPLIQFLAKQNNRTPFTTPSESEPAPTHLASAINTVPSSPSQQCPTVIMWDLPCNNDGTDEPHFCTQYQRFCYKTDHLLHLELTLSAELAEMTCLYCRHTYCSYYQYLEDEKTTSLLKMLQISFDLARPLAHYEDCILARRRVVRTQCCKFQMIWSGHWVTMRIASWGSREVITTWRPLGRYGHWVAMRIASWGSREEIGTRQVFSHLASSLARSEWHLVPLKDKTSLEEGYRNLAIGSLRLHPEVAEMSSELICSEWLLSPLKDTSGCWVTMRIASWGSREVIGAQRVFDHFPSSLAHSEWLLVPLKDLSGYKDIILTMRKVIRTRCYGTLCCTEPDSTFDMQMESGQTEYSKV
ncbi:hypothetical protein EDD85DRAFT_790581 [Armillaria nabsnona]|nr:hypothetical protein EDD85DRAFT_790581 [Armillaria nabsnona]